ncbi:hypothetical protein EZI54_11475 [Marinobacter halodurans]|uniref:Globin domain-containing protein n=1 Tax=Marinobacter halodurans TaxID=2528979 RepID=A0ABY1ZM60_9GAMM|nr:globin domain-containing protein [Marinobacter halodurans]TBW55440.1 hypothetical protein EZI54_11475 [Marinobacter halodurans]
MTGRPTPTRYHAREASAGHRHAAKKDDAELIEESFAALASQAESIVAEFYAHLFEHYPELAPLFGNSSPTEQHRKLLAALKLLVRNLRKPDVLRDYLQGLGARHQVYGVAGEDYDKVADSLLTVLGERAGMLWTTDLEQAWTGTLVCCLDHLPPVLRDSSRRTQGPAGEACSGHSTGETHATETGRAGIAGKCRC